MKRRQYLRGAAAVAVGTATLSGAVAGEHISSAPEHVSLTYNQSVLHAYRPLLNIQYEDQQKLQGLYGWTASSPEYDTDVHCYWASYTHQESPWWAPETGHFGDHEPVQVVSDSDTGEVLRVRASIYHWIKGEAQASETAMGGTNPRLRVINPYHHYTAAPSNATVQEFEVKNLNDVFSGWLDNGLEGDLLVGASTNPWIMETQSDFWAPGEFGLPGDGSVEVPNKDALQARAARSAGFGIVGDLKA